MSFYITLISDSSKHFSPGNKTSHFTTQLPTPITLNDEWEMRLVDFIYPHTWYIILEKTTIYLVLTSVMECRLLEEFLKDVMSLYLMILDGCI
ncbi:hypothetical protein TNIN_101321 [Trichonephila inaurata madagascariensis]|uniref:Uncharacterized protein n=1 Tax=Trichonephila inaurata madagascariensis TaxID=2747483 RepID=A0A8X6I3E2_9ARAC|nr:hypothetical protein TNIN_101321 [Trichonephila inaurata madagascariensis]